MKKKALFLLLIPACGCLLGGCVVRDSLKKVKNKVDDTMDKALDKADTFFDYGAQKEEVIVECYLPNLQ